MALNMSPWKKADPSRITGSLGAPGSPELTSKTCPSAGALCWLRFLALSVTLLPEAVVRMDREEKDSTPEAFLSPGKLSSAASQGTLTTEGANP